MKEKDIQRATSQIVEDVIDKANLKQGAIFVLGISSSEVMGGQIGKESSQEIGEIIVKTILDILEEKTGNRQCPSDTSCRRFRSVGSLQVYAGSS